MQESVDVWERLTAHKLDIQQRISELYRHPIVSHQALQFLTKHYQTISHQQNAYEQTNLCLDTFKRLLEEGRAEIQKQRDIKRSQLLERKMNGFKQAEHSLQLRLKKVFKSSIDLQKAEKEKYELFGVKATNSEEAGFIRAGKVASETVNVGKSILQNLQGQGQRMQHIQSNLEGLLQSMGISQVLSSSMARRLQQDKKLLCSLMILLFLFITVLLYIYSK